MNLKKILFTIAVGFVSLTISPRDSHAEVLDGVYKFTVSWKGDYKFYDGYYREPFEQGYSMKLRDSYRGYMVSEPSSGWYHIIFYDRKTKRFSAVTGILWDNVEVFNTGTTRPREEIAFSWAKTVNITTGNLDIDRSELSCLAGRVNIVNLGTRADRIEHLVPKVLRGSFMRQSSYNSDGVSNTCYVPYTRGKRDFFYNLQAASSGAFSCISGKSTYRLDTKLTKTWSDSGSLSFGGYRAVRDSLLEKGYTDAGTITDSSFTNLANLTGVEPFIP